MGKMIFWFSSLLLCLAACSQSPTAASVVAGQATAHPAVVATAQADQYRRDAAATVSSYEITVAAHSQQLQATAQAATRTAVVATTAEALQVRATEQSLSTTATSQALLLAEQAQQATRSVAGTATAEVVIATRTAVAVQAQATAVAVQSTRQAWELQQAQTQARREEMTTTAWAGMLLLVIGVLVGLFVWFLWRVIPNWVNRAGIVRYGQHGNPLLLLQRNGRTVLTDPLAMLQAAVTVDETGEVVMPELTPAQLQSLLAGGRLHLLGQQAQYAPGHAPQLPAETITTRRLGGYEQSQTIRHGRSGASFATPTQSEQPALPAGSPGSLQDRLPALVDWPQLAGHPDLALGIGGHSETAVPDLITLDLARTPHLFVAGMSGSGKTRRLLRPLVAQALTAGFTAVLLNESGADFQPFYQHPNVVVVRGTASDYQQVLTAALTEMEQREAILRQFHVSEWRRLPERVLAERPLTLLAIDELLALVNLLEPKEQRRFWGLVAAFASRARKVGMCSVGLATDPTYRALGQGGLNYRSQCGRVSFRMIQASGSRAILDTAGAEALADGQFMALLDQPGIIHAVSANPSDAELTQYLSRQTRPGHRHQPGWLPQLPARSAPTTSGGSATATNRSYPVANQLQPVEIPPTTQFIAPQPVDQPRTVDLGQSELPTHITFPLDASRPPTAGERVAIRQLYDDGLSKNAVCRTAYGFKDGKTYSYVTAALEEDEANEVER